MALKVFFGEIALDYTNALILDVVKSGNKVYALARQNNKGDADKGVAVNKSL